MKKSTISDSILNRLEYFVFQIMSSGQIHAVNRSARQLIESFPKSRSLFQDLFNVESYDQVLDFSKSNKKKEAHIFLKDKQMRILRWEFFKFKDYIICMTINWVPLKKMMDMVIDGNLIFKEIFLDIPPEHIAGDLIFHKEAHPKVYRHCSILFTDVVSFSKLSFHLDPVSLIRKLNSYFSAIDRIVEEYGIEKIKTIGDSFMCVSGIPVKKESHAVDCCLAALNILNVMDEIKEPENSIDNLDLNNWSIRIGIHSGPCISGIIGYKKYSFDIWGDSVNIASCMEKSGEPGKINISESTYNAVRDFFDCSYRGIQEIKNIWKIKMYFLEKIKEEYSEDERGFFPNERFDRTYIERYYTKEKGVGSQAVLPHFIENYSRVTKKLKDRSH